MIARRLLLAAVLAFATATPTAQAAPGCPQAIAFDPTSGASTADTGFTGIAHDRPLFGNVLRLAVSCAATTPPCGPCTITGVLPTATDPFLRCSTDTSRTCTVATEVVDCGAVDTCTLFLTVPQAQQGAGALGACSLTTLNGGVSGTLDPDSGALAVTFPYRLRLFPGTSATVACPRCVGDATPNDGLRGGTCDSGPRSGLACDGNGPSLPPYADFGTSSFDCPPTNSSALFALDAGPVTFSTAAQSRTLTAASPACRQTGVTGRKCFCDTCNDAAGEPCQSNADCPPSGGNPGICGGRRCLGGANDGSPCVTSSECPASLGCGRPGEPTSPNTCGDDPSTIADESLSCIDTPPVGDGLGECTFGPTTQRCASHLNRACTTDADCDNGADACIAIPRACFVTDGSVGDTITVAGSATPPVASHAAPTALGMLACLPPTRVNAPDAAIGLPGLTRNLHVGDLTLAEEIVSAIVAPDTAVDTAAFAPASVVETSVTSPTGGLVRIVSAFNGPPAPGYVDRGRRVEITAPATTAASPLTITFTLAASEVPPGGVDAIDVFHDGEGPLPSCLHPTDVIPNDPCVLARSALGGGAVAVTVLSSTGGVFTTVEPTPVACPLDPDTCRTPIASAQALLQLKDKTPDAKDQLRWQWTKGAATTLAELGDPTASDDYALCIYDASGLRMRLPVPAGGICDGAPCWRTTSRGFVYKNTSGGSAGITKVALTSGTAGKAKLRVDGKGDALPLSPFSTLTPPLQAQLRNRTSGLCWGATFSAPFARLSPTDLKAKSD